MHGSPAKLRPYIWLLVILVVIAGLVYILFNASGEFTSTAQVPETPLPYTPPPQPTAADVVSVQQTFQYLVQYTDQGFRPQTMSMKTGETVRFFNAASDTISIEGAGTTSPQLSQGEYWQFTPNTAGPVTFSVGSSTVQISVVL